MEGSWSTDLGASGFQSQGSLGQLEPVVIAFGLCSDGVKLCPGVSLRAQAGAGISWPGLHPEV